MRRKTTASFLVFLLLMSIIVPFVPTASATDYDYDMYYVGSGAGDAYLTFSNYDDWQTSSTYYQSELSNKYTDNNNYVILGVVFRNVSIPQGAKVWNSRFEVWISDYASSYYKVGGKWLLNCYKFGFSAYDADDCDDFVNKADFLNRLDTLTDNRDYTQYVVDSGLYYWQDEYRGYTSRTVTTVIQEVVNRPGWVSGNNITIFMRSYARVNAAWMSRFFEKHWTAWGLAYEASPSHAPQLKVSLSPHIESTGHFQYDSDNGPSIGLSAWEPDYRTTWSNYTNRFWTIAGNASEGAFISSSVSQGRFTNWQRILDNSYDWGKTYMNWYFEQNGRYFWYVYLDIGAKDLLARKGEFLLNGSIAWVAPEQVVSDRTWDGYGASQYPYRYPSIGTNGNGYPFVTCTRYVGTNNYATWTLWSITNDGTWVHGIDEGYSYPGLYPASMKIILGQGMANNAYFYSSVVPLAGYEALAMFSHIDGANSWGYHYCIRWNGNMTHGYFVASASKLFGTHNRGSANYRHFAMASSSMSDMAVALVPSAYNDFSYIKLKIFNGSTNSWGGYVDVVTYGPALWLRGFVSADANGNFLISWYARYNSTLHHRILYKNGTWGTEWENVVLDFTGSPWDWIFRTQEYNWNVSQYVFDYYNDYSETADTGNDMSTSYDRRQIVTTITRDQTAHETRDYGEDYIVNITARFKVTVDDIIYGNADANTTTASIFGIADVLGDARTTSNNRTHLMLEVIYPINDLYRYVIYSNDGGSVAIVEGVGLYSCSASTVSHFISVKAWSENSTFVVDIYNNSAMTSEYLLESLTLNSVSAMTGPWRYVYAVGNDGRGGTGSTASASFNLWGLQESNMLVSDGVNFAQFTTGTGTETGPIGFMYATGNNLWHDYIWIGAEGEERNLGQPHVTDIQYTNPLAGGICEFIATWDDTYLDSWLFSWNASGEWINETSWVEFPGTPGDANITKTLPDTVGLVIAFEFFANNTDGDYNRSGIVTFAIEMPAFIYVDIENTGISGMVVDDWVFVGVTEYQFTIVAEVFYTENATIGMGFYDGSDRFFSMLYERERAAYEYDPTEYTIPDSGLEIELANVVVVESTSLSVTWNVKFNAPIYDIMNTSIWTLARIDDVVEGTWNETHPGYFNIYNLGGLVEYTFTGTGGRTTGGDAFELYAGGEYSGHIRFEDDFESGSLLPHWIEVVDYSTEDSNNMVGVTDYPARQSMYSLRVRDGAVGVPTPYGVAEWDTPVTSGTVSVQTYLRTSDITGGYGQIIITDSLGNQLAVLYMGNSTDYNGWSADDGAVTTYLGADFIAALWYNVTIVLNVTSETFDVFVGGVERATDFDFISSGDPSRIRVEYTHAGTMGSILVDDIVVSTPYSDGNAGTAEAVVYYKNLQNYHSKFSVYLGGCDGVLDDDVVGTYFIEISMEYSYGGEWYNWTTRIEQVDGGSSGKDQYVQLDVGWYENEAPWLGTATRSASPYAFWEGYNGDNDQFGLWVDLWFNKFNYSTIYGGRVNAVYWGIHDSSNPWLRWWSGNDWGPIGEEVDKSEFFMDIQLPNGTIITSRDVEMTRVRVAVNRTDEYDYKVVLRGFDIQDFKTAPSHDIMQGVDTPIFNKPEMPQMAGSGFLAALSNSFAAVGRFLWNGFVLVWQNITAAIWNTATSIWNWLMPYIADSWLDLIAWLGTLPYIGTVIGWLTNFWTYTTTLITGLLTSITYGWEMFWAIISGFFIFWQSMWTVLDLIMNEYGDFVPLMVMVGIIELFREGFEEGNWTPMIDTLRLLFGMMSFFMNWGFRLVEFMADRLIGGLPI